jgi:membrane associated rhomboid family serine protease
MTQVPPPVPQPLAPVCYRHPKRETYVRCSRCDRPICPDCMNEAAVGHQCPECVAAGRRSQRSARTAFGGTLAGAKGNVTTALIGINVFVMIVAIVTGGAGALFGGRGFGGLLGGITPLHFWGSMVSVPTTYANCETCPIIAVVDGVAGGDYYRLITSVFLHYGLVHLLMNMWALWVLGRDLEAHFGRVRFLTLYLLSGLGGSVAVYLFSDESGLTAGASGAIFGLFAAQFVVLKRLRKDTSALIPILIINAVISFVPGISFFGHLGGAVAGAMVGAAFAYAPRGQRTRLQVLAGIGMVVLFLALILTRTAALNAGF